jgi:hypothetical protein
MIQQNKTRFLGISILLSIISIAATLLINWEIAKKYLRSDGKTRALFGITELYQFGYQYYLVILGIISLILVIFSKKEKDKRIKMGTALLLSLLAIAIVFIRIWRLFV